MYTYINLVRRDCERWNMSEECKDNFVADDMK